MRLALKEGDIVLVNLGKVGKAIKGHEQANTRPCLVLKALNTLGMAVIIPFTTKRPGNPSIRYARVPKGNGGLAKDSFALCHQIRSISYKRVSKTLGTLPDHYFEKIKWALSDLLGL